MSISKKNTYGIDELTVLVQDNLEREGISSSRHQLKKYFNLFIKNIEYLLKNDKKVELHGFISIYPLITKPRYVPAAKKNIGERRILRLRTSPRLKDVLNKDMKEKEERANQPTGNNAN